MSRLDRRVIFGQMLPGRRDAEATPDIQMISGFGNTGIIFTEEGVVVVDDTPGTAGRVIETIRARTDKPIYAVIYTHGHGDHAWATAALIEDAQKRGHPRPKVIAHEAVPARFARYAELGRHNRYINGLQSGRSFAHPPPKTASHP